jgi:hypothetical protein
MQHEVDHLPWIRKNEYITHMIGTKSQFNILTILFYDNEIIVCVIYVIMQSDWKNDNQLSKTMAARCGRYFRFLYGAVENICLVEQLFWTEWFVVRGSQ